MLKQLIFHAVLIANVFGLPSVVIKSGIQNSQAEKQHNDVDHHNIIYKLGTSGQNSEGGYNQDNVKQHVSAQDSGKFSHENADKKQDFDKSEFSDGNFQNQQGESLENVNNKQAHKKGHHKSGYHNSYHKDESGSNSSYYDDSDDEGNQNTHDARRGNYGGESSENTKGSHLDEKYNANQDSKQGEYNKGGSFVKDSGDNLNYNKEKVYNNQENLEKINGANNRGSSNQRYDDKFYYEQPYYYEKPYYQEPYYQGPYYYDRPPYYENDYYVDEPYYPEKRVITIYEDPRVYEQSVDYPRYEKYPRGKYGNDDDLIQLDVRPPLTRNPSNYFDQRGPVYENYPI